MNHSFKHFNDAIQYLMSEFDLPREEAYKFTITNMFTVGNTMTLDVSPLVYGTYQP